MSWFMLYINEVYLKGRYFDLHTDHKSLESIMQNEDNSDHIDRWISRLAYFYFKPKYIPGETNRADALLKSARNKLQIFEPKFKLASPDEVKEADRQDSFMNKIIRILLKKEKCPAELRKYKRYRMVAIHLYYGVYEGVRYGLCIPRGLIRSRVLKHCHGSNGSGHPGGTRTYVLVQKYYYWPKMLNSVQQYVKRCEPCQFSKNSHQRPFGVYHPLKIPSRRFKDVNINFVSGMNQNGKYQQVMVIIDRLTKWVIFVSLTKKVTPAAVADVLIENVVYQYGMTRFMHYMDGNLGLLVYLIPFLTSLNIYEMIP
ncbi:hypothetical protein TBLA_0A10140 [Henningerozyma blattae CBS 6284]|uniref:Uncharacterized protein n=1 Tax=Henningerozyma blattae (strain ATCC 34711 / CBS 6284 / DSM 70876 / NBRC 10599 / NRRL Y-10934 / UCD 77-7) TaxID=1071380 RepID=I2GXE1_HENB6|nr:hypothetical protein TBLA_0A10140 [Tetrapisispora blattae CBS 6284]CCH58793.1 hypothetical protein TBLA_0A10140 [Tetrapisispora blattae CBS 6284]